MEHLFCPDHGLPLLLALAALWRADWRTALKMLRPAPRQDA